MHLEPAREPAFCSARVSHSDVRPQPGAQASQMLYERTFGIRVLRQGPFDRQRIYPTALGVDAGSELGRRSR